MKGRDIKKPPVSPGSKGGGTMTEKEGGEMKKRSQKHRRDIRPKVFDKQREGKEQSILFAFRKGDITSTQTQPKGEVASKKRMEG